MKSEDFIPISCSECGNRICWSDCFLDDIVDSPKDYLKDKRALDKGHILCDECYDEKGFNDE